ncbi:MAG TPA: hypothetical protein VL098_00345 [Flavipsychrobacter sp.]|nr:hypothetical protein [Flavipsychrobacter sp.]
MRLLNNIVLSLAGLIVKTYMLVAIACSKANDFNNRLQLFRNTLFNATYPILTSSKITNRLTGL